jgi:tetratricopeptide (TPR) repeat protein
VYSLLAEEALENGQPEQAREYYARCLEIKPDFDPDQVYACLTNYCNLMVKIDQVNTDFAATYCAVAREYEKEKMYDKAHEYYNLALELVPGSQAARQGITNTTAMMNLQNNAAVSAVN